SQSWTETVAHAGRDVARYLQRDLGVGGKGDRAGRAKPRFASGEDADGPAEREQPLAAERPAPEAEEVAERDVRARLALDHAGRLERPGGIRAAPGDDVRAVADARRCDSDPGWDQHDESMGEDLQVDAEARASAAVTAEVRNRVVGAGGGVVGGAPADRA